MRPPIFAGLVLMLLLTAACQEETPQADKLPAQPALNSGDQAGQGRPVIPEQAAPASGPAQQEAAIGQAEQEVLPPAPPLFEDFQGTPQLTLFPRAGDFRPADDSDRLPFWNTFIEHLVKVTGVAEEKASGNRAWVFRSINSIDSVGYFSPLAVVPQTGYRVSFTLAAELPEGASAGIGVLEFNQFLWIAGQYTEETFSRHFRNSQEGVRLTGTSKGEHSFTFTTGPDTAMIHLVLFREGSHDRNRVVFDDIRIAEVEE